MTLDPGMILAFSAPGGDKQTGGLWMLVPYLLIFVVFYFILIAPARKKQKKHSEMISNLKPGDRVVTNGGIYGTVVGVGDDLLQLRIADKVKIDVAKNAVAGMQNAED